MDPDGGDLRVTVLGPVRVEVDGRPVAIAGPSVRRLLTRLALARGVPVEDSVLLDDVWGEGATLPVLHTAVARLRRTLEPERAGHAPGRVLVRVGSGYLLRVAEHGLDADRFVAAARRGATLLDAGRPAEARIALQLALREWSGAALADAAGRPFAEHEIHRLDGLRTDAEELHALALAHLGDAAAIPALERFTAIHPTRERGWDGLVRALCARGRSADALDALRRARRLVREVAGTDLAPGLLALQKAILQNDPALLAPGPPAPSPRLLPTTNLPAPLSSLIGRREELAEVEESLRVARLVSLVGPGGAGKTRLALEAGRRRDDPDGPWFVDLADVRDRSLVIERLGLTLGISASNGLDALVTALRDRATLLLLDNCEQISAEVGAVAEALLAACPRLAILTTSREPISVAGETVLPVAPLSGGREGDAVRLFLARAADAHGFRASRDDVDDAAELCDELDGLPLAIELAAARSGALSIQDLRAGLADRFALLRRDGRSGRHATMLATVEWSYLLLDEDEREVYRALAVFRGGFTLDAVEVVTGRSDAAVLVARLVARSMVAVVEGTRRRYRLLETLLHHAARVTPLEVARGLQARHRDWVRSLAAGADTALRGRLSSTATAELQDESANIRAALDGADIATTLRIGGGFYWFWYREGLTQEGLALLQPALDASHRTPEGVDLGDRCRAAMGVALLSYLCGDLGGASAALERAGADAETCGDVRVQTQYLSTLAYFEAGGGSVGAAQEHAERSLALAIASGDRSGAAESLMVLGEVARQSGDLDRAAATLSDAIREGEASGYTWAAMSSQWIASKVELQAGRLRSARRFAAAGALGSQRALETTSLIVGLVTVAHIDLLLGETERAALVAGGASWLIDRSGFDPAVMDRDLAAWTGAISHAEQEEAFAAARARGRRLSADDMRVLLTAE